MSDSGQRVSVSKYQCTVNTLLVVGGNRKSSKDYEVPPCENDTFLCHKLESNSNDDGAP